MTEVTNAIAPALIETDRLTLRPLQVSDAGLLQLYVSDRRVAEMTRSIPHPYPPGAAEAFVQRCAQHGGSEDVWVIDGTRTGLGEVVGTISLTRMPEAPRPQSEVGYWIAPVFWNTGLASEALEGLLQANPQRLETVFASVFQDNPRSARVLTNAGFDYLGDAEGFSVSRGGTIPTWTYLKRFT